MRLRGASVLSNSSLLLGTASKFGFRSFLRIVWTRALPGGHGIFPRRFALNAALRLQLRVQRGHVGRAQSQVVHASALVLLVESSGDRIPCVQLLSRSQYVTHMPSA